MKRLVAIVLLLCAVWPAGAAEKHSEAYWDELIATSQRAILKDPQSTVAHYNLAVGYFEEGQADVAVKAFHKAVKSDQARCKTLRRFSGRVFLLLPSVSEVPVA